MTKDVNLDVDLSDHRELVRTVRETANSGTPFYGQHGGIGLTVATRYVDDVVDTAKGIGYVMTNQEHIVALGQGCHDSLTFKHRSEASDAELEAGGF